MCCTVGVSVVACSPSPFATSSSISISLGLSIQMAQIIVIGGGLSGLSAAHTCLERGARVLVIDKNPFFGGNSTKATSGINGALTRVQVANGIGDSVESFLNDTARSAAGGKDGTCLIDWM